MLPFSSLEKAAKQMASSKFARGDHIQKTPPVCKGVRPPIGPKPFPLPQVITVVVEGTYGTSGPAWEMNTSGQITET